MIFYFNAVGLAVGRHIVGYDDISKSVHFILLAAVSGL